ncbi:MAG: PEGA domain-containing protein [Planctomycetota bacterium]
MTTRCGAKRWASLGLLPPVLLALSLLAACSQPNQRIIRVTSEPPGARVWLNDSEIGVTPAEATFEYYGVYDVRLRLDGYEPIRTGKKAYAPIREYPGIDLIADLSPISFEHVTEWHFDLEPMRERTQPLERLERELLVNALGLRERTQNESADDGNNN